MLEIVLFLTGVAGVASAAAYKKFPRTRAQLASMGANSSVRSRLDSLRIERDILVKTVSRLHQHGAGISEIQRDRLASKYQYQLGTILAEIKKLEEASRHPDLGPVGDGLIMLMDQKLSSLDQRLHEISAKIAAAGERTADGQERAEKPASRKAEPAPETRPRRIKFTELPSGPRQPVELITLTSASARTERPPIIRETAEQAARQDAVDPGPRAAQAGTVVPAGTDHGTDTDDEPDGTDTDLAKIKREITRTLEKLDQAEVE